MTRAGLPTATESEGIGRVTTEAAPIVVRVPTSAMMIAPAPSQQSAPMLTFLKSPPS